MFPAPPRPVPSSRPLNTRLLDTLLLSRRGPHLTRSAPDALPLPLCPLGRSPARLLTHTPSAAMSRLFAPSPSSASRAARHAGSSQAAFWRARMAFRRARHLALLALAVTLLAGALASGTAAAQACRPAAPDAVALGQRALGQVVWAYSSSLWARLEVRAQVVGAQATATATTLLVRFRAPVAEGDDGPRLTFDAAPRLVRAADGVVLAPLAVPPEAPSVPLAPGRAVDCALRFPPLDTGAAYTLAFGTPTLGDYLRPDALARLVQIGPFRLAPAADVAAR